MRRLREDSRSSDPLTAEAAALVAAERPIAEDGVRRARVLAALESRAPRRRPVRWSAAFAAVLVIALIGVASAAIGRWITERRQPISKVTLAPAPAPALAAPVTSPSPAPATIQVQPDRKAPTVAAQPGPRLHAAPGKPVVAPPLPPPAIEPPAPRHDDPPATAPRVPEEPTAEAVFAATRALRQDHKPRRAANLLDAYMARSPTGALAEEALALDIEAHLQLGDREAVRLGTLYLERFPAGRFRAMAERAARPDR